MHSCWMLQTTGFHNCKQKTIDNCTWNLSLKFIEVRILNWEFFIEIYFFCVSKLSIDLFFKLPVNRYLAINIEGKIGQLTVRRTSSFINKHLFTHDNHATVYIHYSNICQYTGSSILLTYRSLYILCRQNKIHCRKVL
jgi:hypothetical protein